MDFFSFSFLGLGQGVIKNLLHIGILSPCHIHLQSNGSLVTIYGGFKELNGYGNMKFIPYISAIIHCYALIEDRTKTHF